MAAMMKSTWHATPSTILVIPMEADQSGQPLSSFLGSMGHEH